MKRQSRGELLQKNIELESQIQTIKSEHKNELESINLSWNQKEEVSKQEYLGVQQIKQDGINRLETIIEEQKVKYFQAKNI